MRDIARSHQITIAKDTIVMSKEGASMAGGMDHKEAVKVLRDILSEGIIYHMLKDAGHTETDIKSFME
jgi:hypothetical protein